MGSKTTNYDLYMPNGEEMADIDVINSNMDKIDTQMKSNADSAQQSKDIVSAEYSVTKTYAVGDYCIRENVLYRCKTAITTGEAFDSNKWVQTTCGTEFGELNSNLSNVTTYSDTETVIGTLLGKPLYRKIINDVSLLTGSSSTLLELEEGVTIYNYYGRYFSVGQTGDANWSPLPNDIYIIQQIIGSKSVIISHSTSSNPRKIQLIIEYTKATD